MKTYFGIHNHTMYSNLRLIDAINKPDDLINKAIELYTKYCNAKNITKLEVIKEK